MKIGDKYKIHCYKHNGKVYQASDESIVLDVYDDYFVLGNYKINVTELEGKNYQTKELAIIYFYKNNWFNCIAQLKPHGLYYYCNMSSPYIIDENVIKYIDYDLDLRVYPDGKYKILDYHEYKYHQKKMRYPEKITEIIKIELEKLVEMKKNNKGPFNKLEILEYKKKYFLLTKEENK